jgi:NADH-quinone oxidoreductase subunit H
MMDFFWTYVFSILIIVGQSLALLTALLIFIAYILLADRKIWAAVQLRRGPNRVGPGGLGKSIARRQELVFKVPVITTGANKGGVNRAPRVS